MDRGELSDSLLQTPWSYKKTLTAHNQDEVVL